MQTTVEDRAKAMLGMREVRPSRAGRPGCVEVEGTTKKGYTPWHEIDTRRTPWECTCPAYGFGSGGLRHAVYRNTGEPIEDLVDPVTQPRTCKHVRLVEYLIPGARALRDAGILDRMAA